MSANKNICLLGYIDKKIEESIKSLITSSASTTHFNWVPANDKNLDGVVINAIYIEAPQIKKYMSMVGVPIVCTHSEAEGAQLAKAANHQSINPTLRNESVKEWLIALLGEETLQAKPSQAAEQPASVSQSADTQNKNQNFMSTRPVDNQSELHRVKASENAEEDEDYRVLERIKKGEDCVLCAIHGNNATWVKPSEGVVFINYAREQVSGYDQWLWEEVDENSIPAAARQLKLDLWIFETLWQSHIDGAKHIDADAYFRLLRWPQPLSRQGRTEALRLAACAQGYPVNVALLNEKTSYPEERIHRFLFATTTAGQIEQVVGAVPQPPKKTSNLNEEQRAEKRTIISRLRKRLGL